MRDATRFRLTHYLWNPIIERVPVAFSLWSHPLRLIELIDLEPERLNTEIEDVPANKRCLGWSGMKAKIQNQGIARTARPDDLNNHLTP